MTLFSCFKTIFFEKFENSVNVFFVIFCVCYRENNQFVIIPIVENLESGDQPFSHKIKLGFCVQKSAFQDGNLEKSVFSQEKELRTSNYHF